MPLKSFVLLALVCLTLTGCGGVATANTTPARHPPQIIAMHIVRTSADTSQHLPPIDTIIRNPDVAQRLYDATTALPLMPRGIYNCPIDYETAYVIDFTRADGRSIRAQEDPYGCWFVTIGGTDIHQASDSYWSLLARILQITRAQLQPDHTAVVGAPATDISSVSCGAWSAANGSTGQPVAAKYGEMSNCELVGDTWVIATEGLPTQRGALGVEPCHGSATCLDAQTDRGIAVWTFYPAPNPGGVRILGEASPGVLIVGNGGHQLRFTIATGVYQQ